MPWLTLHVLASWSESLPLITVMFSLDANLLGFSNVACVFGSIAAC
jgi:hypothetical protein